MKIGRMPMLDRKPLLPNAACGPHRKPVTSVRTAAKTLNPMIAVYGVMWIGCVLPSQLGSTPSRPIA